MEFIYNVADPNEGQYSTQTNNKLIERIRHEKD